KDRTTFRSSSHRATVAIPDAGNSHRNSPAGIQTSSVETRSPGTSRSGRQFVSGSYREWKTEGGVSANWFSRGTRSRHNFVRLPHRAGDVTQLREAQPLGVCEGDVNRNAKSGSPRGWRQWLRLQHQNS